MKKYQVEIFCFDAGVCDSYVWIDMNDVDLPGELLNKMADLGIVEVKGHQVRADHIGRAYKALRLHRSLGVNLNGTAVILELMDRLDKMHEELQQWKKGW